MNQTTTVTRNIAVLAYGSLIDEPGEELNDIIAGVEDTVTPFEVEFARLSKTRSNAPTLIPVSAGAGAQVHAKLLLIRDGIALDTVKSILWRRETRTKDKNSVYKEPDRTKRDAVRVEVIENFQEVAQVVYTAIPSNMGAMTGPQYLAHFAIESILLEAGEQHKDGLRYLRDCKRNGIVTKHSAAYEAELLSQTHTANLDEAINALDKKRPSHLVTKSDIEDFEKRVRYISDCAFEYGAKTIIPVKPQSPEELKEILLAKREEFLINCHAGFKQAQDLVLPELITIQEHIKTNNLQIKDAKRARNKTEEDRLNSENQRWEFKEKVLRHVMDGIAWQMLQGQLYLTRRLYKGVDGSVNLKESNLESVKSAAAEINKDPQHFALLSDLTSYIQTGDILAAKDSSIQMIEVKEGQRNHEILEIAHELLKTDRPFEQFVNEKQLDKKAVEQLYRQLKQHATMQSFVDIANTDEGLDVETGKTFRAYAPDVPTHRYDDRLEGLREQLKTRNLFGYDVIEDCLHFGMYKGNFRFMGPVILKQILDDKTTNYILQDLRNIINSLNRPIFFLPFPKEFIFDILFGRIIVQLALDLDSYIELHKKFGYNAEWANRKETHAAKEIAKSNLFTLNNKGIKVTLDDGTVIWLAHGTLNRIFFESIHPAYTVYCTKYYPHDSDDGDLPSADK